MVVACAVWFLLGLAAKRREETHLADSHVPVAVGLGPVTSQTALPRLQWAVGVGVRWGHAGLAWQQDEGGPSSWPL